MGYVGARDMADLHNKAQFVRIFGAGLRESHVHDVTITREARTIRAGVSRSARAPASLPFVIGRSLTPAMQRAVTLCGSGAKCACRAGFDTVELPRRFWNIRQRAQAAATMRYSRFVLTVPASPASRRA